MWRSFSSLISLPTVIFHIHDYTQSLFILLLIVSLYSILAPYSLNMLAFNRFGKQPFSIFRSPDYNPTISWINVLSASSSPYFWSSGTTSGTTLTGFFFVVFILFSLTYQSASDIMLWNRLAHKMCPTVRVNISGDSLVICFKVKSHLCLALLRLEILLIVKIDLFPSYITRSISLDFQYIEFWKFPFPHTAILKFTLRLSTAFFKQRSQRKEGNHLSFFPEAVSVITWYVLM